MTAKQIERLRDWHREQRKLDGVFVPIRCDALTNMRCHWGDKASRVKAIRQQVRDAVALRLKDRTLPVRIVMTRYGKKLMDEDNLQSALKPARDGVADVFGVDDGDARYEWVCQQELAPDYGVRIEVQDQEAHP